MTGETVEIGNEIWAKMGDYLYLDEFIERGSDGKSISYRNYPPQICDYPRQDGLGEEE